MTDAGPLTRTVLDYVQTMEELVPTVAAPADWAPLAEFVAVDDFERVGTFLEVQDWQQYTAMLTQWASAIATFETTVRRISEVARPRLLRGRGAALPGRPRQRRQLADRLRVRRRRQDPPPRRLPAAAALNLAHTANEN